MEVKVKLRKIVTGALGLTLISLAGCGESGEKTGDPVGVSGQFMDLYYHKADLQGAKALATPETAQKIVPLESAAGSAQGEEISYMLKEQSREGKHSYALYQITIPRKDGEPIYKTAAIFIDLVGGAWKITLFDEKTQSKPHQEVKKG